MASEEEIVGLVYDYIHGRKTEVQYKWWLHKWEVTEEQAVELAKKTERQKTWQLLKTQAMFLLAIVLFMEVLVVVSGGDTPIQSFFRWLLW